MTQVDPAEGGEVDSSTGVRTRSRRALMRKDALALAFLQGGLVTRRQLRERGHSLSVIRCAARRGILTPHLRAMLVQGGMPEWALHRSHTFQRALVDAHALSLSASHCEPIVTGPTAAVLHGCEGRLGDSDWGDRLCGAARLVYVEQSRNIHIPGVRPIRARFTGTEQVVHGVRLADRTTALVDTLDWMRRAEPVAAQELLDLFLQLRWLNAEDIERRLEHRCRQNQCAAQGVAPGGEPSSRRLTRTLRWARRIAREGLHSPAERLAAKLLRVHGLSKGGESGWVPNHEVAGRSHGGEDWRFRLDFAWPAHRVALEVDGRAFHANAEAYERDSMRTLLLATEGWAVLRVSWSELHEVDTEWIWAVRSCLAHRGGGPMPKGSGWGQRSLAAQAKAGVLGRRSASPRR